MTPEQKQGLGVAFNEAALLGVEVDMSRRMGSVTLRVFTLPTEGPPPEDSRIQILLHPVGRVAASLRAGHWNDPLAKVKAFPIEKLLAT
ncbi:MAG: hypothetical protein ACYC26_07215 [Phycisphaerales bacterium]